MRSLYLAVVCWSAAAAGVAAEPPSWSRIALPRIVAHRGAMAERPENTLAAIRRAIEVGAAVVELDVRMSRDGALFLLHDEKLDRTTTGRGPARDKTIAELKRLDAGSTFRPAYRNERIPTLAEALTVCRGTIDVLLDLKQQGDAFARAVASAVREQGDPQRTILGVHSVRQARRFRRVLPRVRQLGFIPEPSAIESFVRAGVHTIRLWPKWLRTSAGSELVQQVRNAGAALQINATSGTPQDVLPLLAFAPDALLVDDPSRLQQTLADFERHRALFQKLFDSFSEQSGAVVVPWFTGPGVPTFLNRGYAMVDVPHALRGKPRFLFHGGSGHQVRIRFRRPRAVFAVFGYNDTGAWSFPEGYAPQDFGWKLVWKNGYRGTSNGVSGGRPHFAGIYCRVFSEGDVLADLPPWWICLAVTDPQEAAGISDMSAVPSEETVAPPFLYESWSLSDRPLHAHAFESRPQWEAWQTKQRKEFRRRLVFRYAARPSIRPAGKPVRRGAYEEQQYDVVVEGRRIFRFFRLAPVARIDREDGAVCRRPTIVCFMGHGKVDQILRDRASYQHACAARFAESGYLVFAMENVGMEPGRDLHLELDRVLRLDGFGWYSLLFAHQQILLDHVFRTPGVDTERVGVTGVSTGGLLALSAIAMDPRVRTASIQGIFGSMRVSFIRDRRRHCACGAIPGLLPEFDLPEMALLAAPRPLHISNAERDGFGPAEAQRSIARIAGLYQKLGGRVPRFSSPPGGHEYSFDTALAFFHDTLGPGDRPENAKDLISLGMASFQHHDVSTSFALFERAIAADADRMPYLWQRGISCYYLGKFREGRDQFAAHRAVNPHDVENAAWHFLCVARLAGIDAARKALLPIEIRRDRRVPMAEIYAFYAGDGSERQIFAAVERAASEQATMYAHLYVGLYHEVAGDEEQARRHLRLAAEVQLPSSYMRDVARVHVRRRGWVRQSP